MIRARIIHIYNKGDDGQVVKINSIAIEEAALPATGLFEHEWGQPISDCFRVERSQKNRDYVFRMPSPRIISQSFEANRASRTAHKVLFEIN